jgi:alkylation response protein AidB-like acyl-CoA dehydrogenase
MKLDTVFADLAGLAATYREDGDVLRRLPPAVADAFLQHDIYRMLLPHELGGAALDPLGYLQLVEDLASIDGSTASTA